MRDHQASESGQSTVEFVLSLVLLFAFVLFFFQLAMTFAFGSYAHYATFMAARAYLSSGPTREDQAARAKGVIVRMLKRGEGQAGLDRFPGVAKGVGGSDPTGYEVNPPGQWVEDDRRFSWMQGVRYTFESKLFLIPLAGLSKAAKAGDASVNRLKLTSESWLGRESAYVDCVDKKGDGIIDNGC